MVNVNDYYGGSWIKADNLEGDTTLTIESVEPTTYRDGKSGLLVKFQGTDKKWSLNKTNTKSIAYLYGNDTDGWAGKPITIYKSVTDYQGTPTPCVRVRLQQDMPPQQRDNAPAPTPYVEPQQASNFAPPQFRSSPGPNTEEGDPGPQDIPF